MAKAFRRSLSIALGALATATLGGCYYGDVYGTSYASGGDCASRYGADYYDYDGYAYDDGYGYDCYDGADYGAGFVNIGFGGGWYDNYYYPGYGLWLFDSYNNRYPLRGSYLNYWGGRRAWWKYHGERGDGNWGHPDRGDHDGRPGRGDGDGRPGGWDGRPGHGDGQHGTRPLPGTGNGSPPTSGNPVQPPRGPGAGRPQRPPQTDGDSGYSRPPRAPRNIPATEPGEVFTAPPPAAQRPPRNWTPPSGSAPRGPEVARPPRQAPTAGQPGGYRPAPTPQATSPAPAARSAPPAVQSAPEPRATPRERPSRVDRQNHGREE